MRSRATRAPDDDTRAGSAVPAAGEGQAAGSGLNDAQRYGHLFRFMPIPLLQLDRGELADVFDALRAEGVADLHRHIDQNPSFLEYALNSIKIREVNQRTVDLFEANDANRLLSDPSSDSGAKIRTYSVSRWRHAIMVRPATRPRSRSGHSTTGYVRSST